MDTTQPAPEKGCLCIECNAHHCAATNVCEYACSPDTTNHPCETCDATGEVAVVVDRDSLGFYPSNYAACEACSGTGVQS